MNKEKLHNTKWKRVLHHLIENHWLLVWFELELIVDALEFASVRIAIANRTRKYLTIVLFALRLGPHTIQHNIYRWATGVTLVIIIRIGHFNWFAFFGNFCCVFGSDSFRFGGGFHLNCWFWRHCCWCTVVICCIGCIWKWNWRFGDKPIAVRCCKM